MASSLSLIGWGLLVLSGASGAVLFARSAFSEAKDFHGKPTLWGLFLVGLIGGLILVLSAANIH
jgi:hypothetical protein